MWQNAGLRHFCIGFIFLHQRFPPDIIQFKYVQTALRHHSLACTVTVTLLSLWKLWEVSFRIISAGLVEAKVVQSLCEFTHEWSVGALFIADRFLSFPSGLKPICSVTKAPLTAFTAEDSLCFLSSVLLWLLLLTPRTLWMQHFGPSGLLLSCLCWQQKHSHLSFNFLSVYRFHNSLYGFLFCSSSRFLWTNLTLFFDNLQVFCICVNEFLK